MKTALMGIALACAVAGAAFAEDVKGGAFFRYQAGDFEALAVTANRGRQHKSVMLGDTPVKSAFIDRLYPSSDGEYYQAETHYFLLKSKGTVLLIDTGFGSAVLLQAALDELRVSKSDIGAILLSHCHTDHTAGLLTNRAAAFPSAMLYLSAAEHAFWQASGGKPVLDAYAGRVKTFTPGSLASGGAELFPGVFAIDAAGHTPGHAMFLAQSKGAKLLFIGDVVHIEDVQFPMPSISVRWDNDAQMAAVARRAVFEYVAKNGMLIAGAHLRYPAMGGLKAGKEGFVYTPAAHE